MRIKIFFDEEWINLEYKDVKPMYEISNKARVRNKNNGKILSISYSERQYAMVSLMTNSGKQKTYKLHRIMGFHFLELPDFNDGNVWTVNHIDGTRKFDNTADNIEWLTFGDNVRHSFETGLNKGLEGESNGQSIHSADIVHAICELMQRGLNNREVKKELINKGYCVDNINRYTLYDIRHRKIWKHISQNYDY